MSIGKTKQFIKRYRKLPKFIQRKVDKQILFLADDFYHPSLRVKKLMSVEDWWEFRVDYNYRMIGKKTDSAIILHSVGTHDEGLGKK